MDSGDATCETVKPQWLATDNPRVTTPSLDDLERGAAVARALRDKGVKGPLIKAAEAGYITEMKCGMPKCFCPEALGGSEYFERRTHPWSPWEPTFEHFPTPKHKGGRETPDNAVLAHRLCNKLDYADSAGWPTHKDLAKVEEARLSAMKLIPHQASSGGAHG